MDITTIKKDAEEKMQMTLEFLDETLRGFVQESQCTYP